MIQSFLSSLRSNAAGSDQQPDVKTTRRRFPRRAADHCVAVIYGQTFPVQDWSQAGTLLTGDDRLFSLGQDLEFTLKFKLRNKIVDVQHTARVVRKGASRIALEFAPLSRGIRSRFQQVIDDAVAGDFASSQA